MTDERSNEPTSTVETLDRSRLDRLIDALSEPSDGGVRVDAIRQVLAEAGLRTDDPRMARSQQVLGELEGSTVLTKGAFLEATHDGLLLLESAAARDLVIPDFAGFRARIEAIFDDTLGETSGAVADYIPQLGRVRPDQFGLAVCTVDGQRATFGDARVPTCIQSVSKPLNYAFALEEIGEAAVHRHMGCEPSGVSFNELALSKAGVPHNPMINAGGIMSAALIRRDLPVADRFDHVVESWTRLAGGARPGFNNSVYLSERTTADRNFALGYSMREHGAFPEESSLIEDLEFYFQCCSLEMTADSLAVVAATLANGGICPLTGERVLATETVQRCLSLMLSCGMYDYSGEWAFRIGLPAKSGVSGVVLTVVPNVMGICTFSPRLDAQGNSVRGIGFCRRLVDAFAFHVYDGLGGAPSRKDDPSRNREARDREFLVDLCWAASEGDCNGIQRLLMLGAAINGADYDGRTPLHLAASEGRIEAIELLLAQGADANARDRWGNRALDDAEREGRSDAAALLRDAA